MTDPIPHVSDLPSSPAEPRAVECVNCGQSICYWDDPKAIELDGGWVCDRQCGQDSIMTQMQDLFNLLYLAFDEYNEKLRG